MALGSGSLSKSDSVFDPNSGVSHIGNLGAEPISTPVVLTGVRSQTGLNQLRGSTVAGSTGIGIPKQVMNVSATTASASQGSTSKITITFQRDPSDKSYGGVVIYVKGYQGNRTPTQIAAGTDSPLNVILNNTGESVSVIVQAIGNAGSAPLATAPTTGLILPKNPTGGFGTNTTTNITSTQVTQIAAGASVGTRANLPATPGSAGTQYFSTDSPYTYVSDGTLWRANVYGFHMGIDPGADSSVVLKSTATFTGSTSSTSSGGILFTTGTVVSGDHLQAWVKPVTPSSTLKIALLRRGNTTTQTSVQHGVCIYNANNGHWVFLRDLAGGGVLYSRYQDVTGFNANENTVTWSGITAAQQFASWPFTGIWGLSFDGTNWTASTYADDSLFAHDPNLAAASQVAPFTEALATWIGTNFTHVGVGANPSVTSTWFQWIKIVTP